jgi:hypothetical protein
VSRRSTTLHLEGRDGASQRGRALPELSPASVAIDERGHADLLAFVRALAEQLRFFSADDGELRDAGTWAPFARRDDITVADVVAYMQDPARFDGDRARWLGRPHFALLLTFLSLLGHAREQLNGLTGRHLDHYYRDILQMRPEPATPDRASVVFRLAAGVSELRVPAGTALQAGRDSSGAARIYCTERELLVNRARVDALRSVHVHRRVTAIPDVREDRGLSPDEAFDGALRIALGAPRPGDPVPLWRGLPVDRGLVLGLPVVLDFAQKRLFLEHHELRALMALVRRRADADADAEWAEINRLLGVQGPTDPRDLAANLTRVVGPLDFAADGLAQVDDLDDLYERRAVPEVRAYIDRHLAAVGYENFAALMAIKRRIDAEWAEINRILARLGARQRGLLAWELGAAQATDFTANLARALGAAWPPPWPSGAVDLGSYEAMIRALEAHFAMSAERLTRLAACAAAVATRSERAWRELDALLTDAHQERHHAARRAALAAVRGDRSDLPAFDAVVGAALGQPGGSLPWEAARAQLAPHLDPGQQALLDGFRAQLLDPAAPRRFTWYDVERSLELAQRRITGAPEPVARKIEWRGLHALEDPAARAEDPASPRWRTFGRPARASEAHPPAAPLGFALCSPSLALSQGQRALTLTLGLRDFDQPAFLRDLALLPELLSDSSLRAALHAALRVEVSGAKGWIELPLAGARLATGRPGDDYWSLLAEPRALAEDRPGLRLQLVVGPELGPLAPIPGSADRWPTLRLTLRPRWDASAREWTTNLSSFEPLVLAAVHLRVEVEGLVDLRLQHEDRPLDPRRPFEPFGRSPAVGARLYLSHPELVGPRLDRLRLDLTWMGLPSSLRDNYRNYPGIAAASDFKARISLLDRGLTFPLADIDLFTEGPEPAARTAAERSALLPDIPGTIAAISPGYHYTRRDEPSLTGDLRRADRYFQCELTPIDFGHGAYPVLAARGARQLAIGLARGAVDPNAAQAFALDPPYTPTIQRIAAAYRASIELHPGAPGDDADRLLHVHPFGVSPIDPADPRLLPRYDAAGELYIGLCELAPPQRLALLWVVAEGTAAADRAAPVEWSVLDGDRWRPLAGHLLHDSTRGLLNSGIIELDLPAVAASTRLPAGRYWLRAAVADHADGVCDTVEIRAQAVAVRFDDRDNAPDHYTSPLPVRSLDRLLVSDPRVAAVEQPYTSFGGAPAESPDHFYTRVSERLRHKQRALTPWDYERLVLQRFPGIYKASCLPVGAPGEVEIIVIPDIRQRLPSDAYAPRAPADLLAEIQAYLAALAPAAARVRVRNPSYVAVAVRLGVRFMPGQDPRHAQKRLSEDLSRFLSPWAYDEGAELTIGGRIYASSILDFVDRRDYVDYVAELRLARSDNGVDFTALPPTDEDYHVAAERPDQALVAAREHHIDIISAQDYQQTSFTGINYLKVELDFIIS